MAQDDWAIVVGVRVYPGLTDLEGPENDANAIYAWLSSPHGGDVPKEQMALILSSQFPAPPSPTRAEPAASRLSHPRQALRGLVPPVELLRRGGSVHGLLPGELSAGAAKRAAVDRHHRRRGARHGSCVLRIWAQNGRVSHANAR